MPRLESIEAALETLVLGAEPRTPVLLPNSLGSQLKFIEIRPEFLMLMLGSLMLGSRFIEVGLRSTPTELES